METVLRHMCEGLLQRGHKVSAIVAGTDAEERCERLSTRQTGNPGRLIRAGSLAVVNSQPLIPSLPSLLRQELNRLRPDIVQIHLPNPGACAACLALLPRNFPGRLAVWYHSDIVRQRLGRWLLSPLIRSCLQRAAGIAVSSQNLARHSRLLRTFDHKVRVIPFGIDIAEWETLDRNGAGPFLFVGRLVYYKGIQCLLEALRLVPAADLVVVGSGPLLPDLRELAGREGVAERVRFAGDVSVERLREEMAAARALILPSLHESETFGLVQLEAMAAGLPVISTDLPTGVTAVNIDGVTGRVVPAADVAALARSMAEILVESAAAESWGEAGRQRVREHFSLRQMVAGLESWYEDLLENQPPGNVTR
ncbi:MAG: glycosyltransferase [bacterium]